MIKRSKVKVRSLGTKMQKKIVLAHIFVISGSIYIKSRRN